MIIELILPWVLAWLVGGFGAYLVAVLDRYLAGTVQAENAWLAPLASAAWLMTQQTTTTEAPDARAWRLAPAFYLALAATGLALVPWSPNLVGVDMATGLVLWGSLEALAR